MFLEHSAEGRSFPSPPPPPPTYRICLPPPKLTNNIWEMSCLLSAAAAETDRWLAE